MGCGKTSVGKLLSELLDYGFMDTDLAIEKLKIIPFHQFLIQKVKHILELRNRYFIANPN